MKSRFLLLSFFLPCLLSAQTLTGIWQGYFYPDISREDSYKYEVQLNHISNKSIKGVTYSYQQRSFFGKADLQGIYMASTNSLVLKEENLVEVRKSPGSEAQIMTCYLTYSKIGSTEYLNGTYSSVSVRDGSMGGNGKVFLEKVEKTDFVKEPFLKNGNTKSNAPKTIVPAKTPNKPIINVSPNVKITGPARVDTSTPVNTINTENIPIPSVIKNRENRLVKKIVTNSPDIKIELYDNGEIDGDTITVYHNYNIIANRKGLSYKPIIITTVATEADSLHEFIMVANNLGSIPPNTALMVITTGGKRYELFIGTDERKNAKVIVEYKKSK